MASPAELDPPPDIVPTAEGTRDQDVSSDSDDQFTDARSAPMTPFRSPAMPKEIDGFSAMHSSADNADDDDDDTHDTTPAADAKQHTSIEPSKEDAADNDDENDDDEPPAAVEDAEDEDEDFGDDFDDFEEGAQDDDFDDFEDGFQQPQAPAPAPQPQAPQIKALPFAIPDFDGLGLDEVMSTSDPLLTALFPPETLDIPTLPPLSKDSSVFLTPRSASLWSQLVAPPPLAPPDWIRSRTRRLFLVSLGVPVDLDEILPASKQKKLVLPSLNLSATSPRTSSDSRSVSNLRQGDGNASTTSLDAQGKPSASSTSKRKKGPAPEPELDLVAAKYLCSTTDEALDGMTDEELKAHIAKLEALEGVAKEALEYWQKKTDEKIGDREAFEGVIENLVKHARKVRK